MENDKLGIIGKDRSKGFFANGDSIKIKTGMLPHHSVLDGV